MHLEIAAPDWVNIPEQEFYQLQVRSAISIA
jgi:hypothetical protein